MHSQEQLSLLLQNPIVQELLDILENEGKCVLKHLDLSHVDEVFEQRKSTRRGRPWIYTPSDKLKAFLYGLSEGKDSIHAIACMVQTSVAQVFLDLEQGGMSYTTLERFWHRFAIVAESVFKELAVTIANLGILGTIQAVDSTSITTPYLDDPDAVWSYDATKKDYYYGYGLLLTIDVETQLPIAARFVQRKQATKEEWTMVIHDGILVKKPTILLGDSGLDIVELQEQLIDDHILPIITYNPRNTDHPMDIKYRAVQNITRELKNHTSDLSLEERQEIRKMAEAGITKKRISQIMGLSFKHVQELTKDVSEYGMIPFSLQNQIKQEYQDGYKSQTQIAKELNVSRCTVGKYGQYQGYTYQRYTDVPQEVIDEIRRKVRQGVSKSQVAREMKISRAKVTRFTKDIEVGSSTIIKQKAQISKEIKEKIRKEVRDGKPKIQVARELNIPIRMVYFHTQDILSGHPHNLGITGLSLELLQEILRNGYCWRSFKFDFSIYRKLKLKCPEVQRVKMYGMSIYFITEHANEACKEFTSKVKKKITSYQQLNEIIKTFDAVVEKSEREKLIRK